MSRIYSETAHEVVVHQGAAGWDEAAAREGAKGVGFILDAEVLRVPDRATMGGKRYSLLFLKYRAAFRRRFAEDGREIEAVKKDEAVKNKGFLNKVVLEVRQDYAMSLESVHEIVNPFVKAAGLPTPYGRDEDVHLLCDEDTARPLDLTAGQVVRLKTVKDTGLVEMIAVVDTSGKATALNFVGGEQVGEGWTDKLQRKGGASAEPIPGEELEGVDEDEWDDDADD